MEIRINSTEYTRLMLDTALDRRTPQPDDIRLIAGDTEDNTLIAVCATPKSGSTLLTNVLMQATARPYLRLCYAYASNEHDLYLPALFAGLATGGAVSQLHIRATPHNAALFKLFRIRPIVLVRNIYDAVESLARDLRRKQSHKGYGTGWVGYSFVWLDHNISALSDEQLLDFVIDMALPWYINFYVSWAQLEKQNQINPIWLSYEDLMADKKNKTQALLNQLGLGHFAVHRDMVEKNYLQDNPAIGSGSGSSGKGLEALNDRQIERIGSLLSFYADVDFSRFGA